MSFLTKFRSSMRDEDGATATEYVFLLVFIALVIVGGATLLGNNIDSRFSEAGSQVQSA